MTNDVLRNSSNPAADTFWLEFASRVPTFVMRCNVDWAPQPRVLGYGDDQGATRLQCPVQLSERPLVFADVLQHVKGPDGIELGCVGNVTSVHLHQSGAGQPFRRECQAVDEDLAAAQRGLRKLFGDGRENESRPTPDLEEGLQLRGVLAQRPDDQAIARPEPEVPCLHPGEVREVGGIEPATLMRERGSVRLEAVDADRLGAARRTRAKLGAVLRMAGQT